MPTVDLSLKQLTSAVRQLSRDQLHEFLSELSRGSSSEYTRLDEMELRKLVMTTITKKQQSRLSALLAASKRAALTPTETAELNRLVDEVERVTLQRTEAMHELYRRGIDLRPEAAVQRARKR